MGIGGREINILFEIRFRSQLKNENATGVKGPPAGFCFF